MWISRLAGESPGAGGGTAEGRAEAGGTRMEPPTGLGRTTSSAQGVQKPVCRGAFWAFTRLPGQWPWRGCLRGVGPPGLGLDLVLWLTGIGEPRGFSEVISSQEMADSIQRRIQVEPGRKAIIKVPFAPGPAQTIPGVSFLFPQKITILQCNPRCCRSIIWCCWAGVIPMENLQAVEDLTSCTP